MDEIPTPADYVAVEIAGKAVGIPARTLRYWISTGKLAAIAGKRGKLVSIAEVAQLARMVGKSGGNPESADRNSATSAAEPAGNVAESLAESALVSDAARLQLATIRDEWLAPLIARIGELEHENGKLEAERDELRRRAEIAEVAVSRRREETEAAQAAHDTLHGEGAPAVAREDTAGVWGRLRRWWRGAHLV